MGRQLNEQSHLLALAGFKPLSSADESGEKVFAHCPPTRMVSGNTQFNKVTKHWPGERRQGKGHHTALNYEDISFVSFHPRRQFKQHTCGSRVRAIKSWDTHNASMLADSHVAASILQSALPAGH